MQQGAAYAAVRKGTAFEQADALCEGGGEEGAFLQALLKLGREIRDIAKGAGKDPVIEQGGEVVRKQGKLPPDGVQGGNGDKRRERVRIPAFQRPSQGRGGGKKGRVRKPVLMIMAAFPEEGDKP